MSGGKGKMPPRGGNGRRARQPDRASGHAKTATDTRCLWLRIERRRAGRRAAARAAAKAAGSGGQGGRILAGRCGGVKRSLWLCSVCCDVILHSERREVVARAWRAEAWGFMVWNERQTTCRTHSISAHSQTPTSHRPTKQKACYYYAETTSHSSLSSLSLSARA